MKSELTGFGRRVLWALALMAMASSVANAQQAGEVAKRVLPSVAMLVMRDANGKQMALGSGFTVRPGVVATNAHVIEDAAGGVAVFGNDETEYPVAGIVGFNARHDIALLRIRDAPKQARPLSLARGESPEVGDTVYAIGSPRGMAGTFSDGIVSAVRDIDDARIVQTTAPISPGSSGGPLVNENGKVIGVTVALIANGQNLNFAISAHHLSPLLDDLHEPKPLGKHVAKPGESGESSTSIFDQFGGSAAAAVEGGSFVWTKPRLGVLGLSFTVRNQYAKPVKLNAYQVRIYDTEGALVKTRQFQYHYQRQDVGIRQRPSDPVREEVTGGVSLTQNNMRGGIMLGAGEARRLTIERFDKIVHSLNSPSANKFPHRPAGKVEFRAISFELTESRTARTEVDIQIIGKEDETRFDKKRFTVRSGQIVQLTISRSWGGLSSRPPGNLVILEANVNPSVFYDAARGEGGNWRNHHVPKSLRNHVIAFTHPVGKESDTITFKAPDTAGEYPFLSTLRHSDEGMRGVMIVKE